MDCPSGPWIILTHFCGLKTEGRKLGQFQRSNIETILWDLGSKIGKIPVRPRLRSIGGG
jgi:hypothetical protein